MGDVTLKIRVPDPNPDQTGCIVEFEIDGDGELTDIQNTYAREIGRAIERASNEITQIVDGKLVTLANRRMT